MQDEQCDALAAVLNTGWFASVNCSTVKRLVWDLVQGDQYATRNEGLPSTPIADESEIEVIAVNSEI